KTEQQSVAIEARMNTRRRSFCVALFILALMLPWSDASAAKARKKKSRNKGITVSDPSRLKTVELASGKSLTCYLLPSNVWTYGTASTNASGTVKFRDAKKKDTSLFRQTKQKAKKASGQ